MRENVKTFSIQRPRPLFPCFKVSLHSLGTSQGRALSLQGSSSVNMAMSTLVHVSADRFDLLLKTTRNWIFCHRRAPTSVYGWRMFRTMDSLDVKYDTTYRLEVNGLTAHCIVHTT